MLNAVIAIVQQSYKSVKETCTPPTVFGLCYAEPLATEVLLMTAASMILIAILLTIPWMWTQFSSMIHRHEMKKEEREVKLNHEEEMLRGIRFEELRRAEERLDRLSRPAERIRVTSSTLPRTHRVAAQLNRMSEEPEEQVPLASINPNFERDLFTREVARRLSTEALVAARDREMDRPGRTTGRPRPMSLQVRSPYPSAASFPN